MDPPSLPRTLFPPSQCGQLLRVCNFANCRPRFDYFLFTCCLLLSEQGGALRRQRLESRAPRRGAASCKVACHPSAVMKMFLRGTDASLYAPLLGDNHIRTQRRSV